MFQSIAEIIFDSSYLILITVIGILILKKATENAFRIFGLMSLILVLGDSFHLIPRIIALATDGLENHTEALGFGTFTASISMTLFYVLLYHFAVKRYRLNHKLTIWIYGLAIVRIILCFFPQNQWQSENPPIEWAIYRNIPFAILGILMMVLFYHQSRLHKDENFKNMWLAIFLSFAFYLPVVLFANQFPVIGILMIPKTIAYIWMILMGWKALRI